MHIFVEIIILHLFITQCNTHGVSVAVGKSCRAAWEGLGMTDGHSIALCSLLLTMFWGTRMGTISKNGCKRRNSIHRTARGSGRNRGNWRLKEAPSYLPRKLGSWTSEPTIAEGALRVWACSGGAESVRSSSVRAGRNHSPHLSKPLHTCKNQRSVVG